MKRYIMVFSCILLLSFFLLVLSNKSYAYDDKNVHPKINENAFKQSNFYLGTLIESFGFNTVEKKLKVEELIKKGGKDEDGTLDIEILWIPLDLVQGRYLRHFHDPLKPWGSAGLTLTMPDSDSNLLWAQNPDQDFSWQNARILYYEALTTGNEQAFAGTFLTLGHLMHLIADMAVPAHVRDDAHPLGTGWYIPKTWRGDFYEKWAMENYDDVTLINYTILPGNQPIVVDPSIFAKAHPDSVEEQHLAPAPITALWDQNVYDGNNPGVTKSPDLSLIGLAEYTSANFFSQDTIFKDYNYPSRDTNFISETDWMNSEQVAAEDNVVDNRVYVWGYAGGTGGNIRLAAASLFSRDCMNVGYPPPMQLDENTNKDYASQLLPRTVGYSAALLDYFFRGKLEVTPPDRFVFGIIDDADFFDPATGARTLDSDGFPVEQMFTQLKAKVRNASDDEIGSGTIQLVARYIGRDDFNPDLMNDPPQRASVQDGNGNFYPYSYSVSLPVWVPALSKSTAAEFTFNFSDSPIPAGITDLDIFAVFKGTLGQELNDAVAVGRIAEMNEPFHYAVENSTDYEIGSDGNLYRYPDTGWSKDSQVCFSPYPGSWGSCQLPPSPTTVLPGEYSKLILLYAGQALGVNYQDTYSAPPGTVYGFINNWSRSKFLSNDPADVMADPYGFRGVYQHGNFLTYNNWYAIDPYAIPEFNDPGDPNFHLFTGMPVRVNIAP